MKVVSRTFVNEIKAELEESVWVKQRVIDEQVFVLEEILQILLQALRAGNKVILFGNGGSAADSQHIAAELISKFRRDRSALPAIALTTDTSILTSIANDFSFDYVFSRQIEGLGEQGDVALGISTSGNSQNVINALRIAKEMGMTAIGFTGSDGGILRNHVDICFCVPSQSTPRIQEVHIAVAHTLCELIEQEFFGRNA
jgi:D-sedoheptulose 7-phosphate isomerase